MQKPRKAKTPKLETRLLTDLTIHPFIADSPMLAENHPDVRNLMAAMADEGLAEHPIVINPHNQIMDGRHRAMAARLLKWTEIPVIVRPEAKAEEIIFHAIMARRHMLKWQIAYSIAPVIERHVEKGIEKRTANLKIGKNTNVPPKPASSGFRENAAGMTLFIEQSGICEDVWRRVREVRARFTKRPDLRSQYEPRMFLVDTDPNYISLEGVMKATGSVESYENDKPDLKAKRGQYDRLALEYMRKAAGQLEFWDKLGAPQQEKLSEEAVKAVILWPLELKKELLKALQQDVKHASN